VRNKTLCKRYGQWAEVNVCQNSNYFAHNKVSLRSALERHTFMLFARRTIFHRSTVLSVCLRYDFRPIVPSDSPDITRFAVYSWKCCWHMLFISIKPVAIWTWYDKCIIM